MESLSYTPLLFYLGSFLYPPYCFMWGVFLTCPCCFMWGFSLTHIILFYVGSFSYIPHAVLYGEFFFHAPRCFMWVVSLTHPWCFLSYTPGAGLCGECVLHILCYFMPGICPRHRVCWYQHGKHGPIGAQQPLTQVNWQVWAYWRAAATDLPNLGPNVTCSRRTLRRCSATWHNLTIDGLVWSLSYTPKPVFMGKFLLHVPCNFLRKVSLTRAVLASHKNYSYIHASSH